MSDIILINTPILWNYTDPDSGSTVPPLGLGYIYTQIVQAGFSCRFIDAICSNLTPKEVREIVKTDTSPFIAMNIFSSNIEAVKFIVENNDPEKTFLLGGPAIKFLIDEIAKWESKSRVLVITGDAELIVPQILAERSNGSNRTALIEVVNVSVESPYYPTNIDLPIDRTIFAQEPISRPDLGLIESHIIASRGCIYNCAFCSAASSLNKLQKPRFRSSESLSNEISNIKDTQKGVNCIRILDDLFLRDIPSIQSAISLFSPYNLQWRSMAHVNTFVNVPASLLHELRNSGCHELFLGIESGDDQLLQRIHKPFRIKTATEVIQHLLDAQISVKCFFILGFPGETKSQAENTIALATDLKGYSTAGISRGNLRISAFRFRPYHGTALYAELVSKGLLIRPITNRIDIESGNRFDPYDCVSGTYSEYNETELNNYIMALEGIND